MNRLQEIGIAAGIVETAEDMHNDSQFKHRNHFLTFDHPVIGPHTVDALPPKLSKSPARQYIPEPSLSGHNTCVCTVIYWACLMKYLSAWSRLGYSVRYEFAK